MKITEAKIKSAMKIIDTEQKKLAKLKKISKKDIEETNRKIAEKILNLK